MENRLEIRPEPSADERTAIEAAVAEQDDEAGDGARSEWRRAALEEAVGVEDSYGFAPGL